MSELEPRWANENESFHRSITVDYVRLGIASRWTRHICENWDTHTVPSLPATGNDTLIDEIDAMSDIKE